MPPMRYSHNNLPCDEYRRRICARTRILYKKARYGSNLITYGQVQITYGQVQIRSHMKAVFSRHCGSVDHDQQLCDRHCEPYRVGADYGRKNHNQKPLMTSPCATTTRKAAPAFMIAWKYHDPHKRSSAFTWTWLSFTLTWPSSPHARASGREPSGGGRRG